MLYSFAEFSEKKIIEENKSDEPSYGCIMLDVDMPTWDDITANIEQEDVYDPEDHGIEDGPHVTILYGIIEEETSVKEIKQAVKKFNAPTLTIGTVSIFENDEFDVVKFDIDSKDLHKMNAYLRETLPYHEKFPDYHPHIP